MTEVSALLVYLFAMLAVAVCSERWSPLLAIGGLVFLIGVAKLLIA